MKNKKIITILILIILSSLLFTGCSQNSILDSDTYSLSGQVTDQSSNGIENVIVNFSGGYGIAETDINGFWEKTDLKNIVTITPTKESYIFNPSEITVKNSREDLVFEGEKFNNNIKLGMVTDTAGLEPYFSSRMYEGLKNIKQKYGIDVKVIESVDETEYENNFSTLAEDGYDLIWGFGNFIVDSLNLAASNYPNTYFGLIDASSSNSNVLTTNFKVEEGSYLIGVIAGMKTENNKVSFIGGERLEVIEKYQAGYEAGVKAVNPDAEIIIGYTGVFDDAQAGKELALSHIDQDVDVIYQASGACSVGVISAAEEQNIYTFGFDQTQNHLAPDNVLTSMIKKLDTVVYNESEALLLDEFKIDSKVYGLKNNGVGIYRPQAEKMLSQNILDTVDEYKKKIISGEITVPTIPSI